MQLMYFIRYLLIVTIFQSNICNIHSINIENKNKKSEINTGDIIVGANQISRYIDYINKKNIGIVANHTSVIFKKDNSYTHLVDSLLSLNVNISKIFTPEHGYKGENYNGENVEDKVDQNTGLEIISLHGKDREYGKISDNDLIDIDLMIFDIQDVGTRFYTHISTLHYVMEACARNNIPLLVFDRPNPNGSYIDGPVLENENKSFVGMHPVPIVYGMTIGEYAQMINGESWLNSKVKCNLKVIEILNYKRDYNYSLLIKPSPNLPNERSISLYPSLCLFEGTNVSVGRGTTNQFQVIGSPYLDQNIYSFTFIPKPNQGSKYPPHNNIKCYGLDLRDKLVERKLNLSYIVDAYKNTKNKSEFFNNYFIKLSGTKDLKTQIINNTPEEIIRKSWKDKIDEFKLIRKKYLIYK
tara:strand:+ start:91 stop:1323 length:1233 start_codon:yes stop_codon:yes gene_type:complete